METEILNRIRQMMAEIKPREDFVLFINMKDWTPARRDMRKAGGFVLRRVSRQYHFLVFYRDSLATEIYISKDNLIPTSTGQFLKIAKPKLMLDIRREVTLEYEPLEPKDTVRWARWRCDRQQP